MKHLAAAIALTCLAGPVLADPIQNLPADRLTWEQTPEGVAFAALRGDRFSEPYMAMVRLPAGLVSPAHTKSADMFGVMIEGTMTHVATGEEGSVPLSEGAFYRIPAGVPHVSSCISQVDCVTFLSQDGRFDFLPVTQ